MLSSNNNYVDSKTQEIILSWIHGIGKYKILNISEYDLNHVKT